VKTRALLGAALAGAVFASLADASTPLVGRPTIPDCGAQVVSPKALTLACGDGNYGLTGMFWGPTWGQPSAAAKGLAQANDCTPYCAAGHFHTYPVTATASKIRTCLTGGLQYTLLVLRYPGKRPPGVHTTETWKFPCDASGPGPQLTAKPLGGRRVELVGIGWTHAGGCPRTVALGYLDGGAAPFARPAPDNMLAFHIVWQAPRTGRLVVVASQFCVAAKLGSRMYESAVAVTVR
jgi:hypothetical protein